MRKPISEKMFSYLMYYYGLIANEFVSAVSVSLTHEEFVDAFIQPEHVDVLRKAHELCGKMVRKPIIGCEVRVCTSSGKEMLPSIRFVDELPLMLPTYTSVEGVQPSCRPETIAKLTEYADKRFEIGRLFGDGITALRFLQNNCCNAMAMKLLFPALPALLAGMDKKNGTEDGPATRLANRLIESKASPPLPAMRLETKERMMEVSAFLNNLSLVEFKATPLPSPASNEGQLFMTSLWDRNPRQKTFGTEFC